MCKLIIFLQSVKLEVIRYWVAVKTTPTVYCTPYTALYQTVNEACLNLSHAMMYKSELGHQVDNWSGTRHISSVQLCVNLRNDCPMLTALLFHGRSWCSVVCSLPVASLVMCHSSTRLPNIQAHHYT